MLILKSLREWMRLIVPRKGYLPITFLVVFSLTLLTTAFGPALHKRFVSALAPTPAAPAAPQIVLTQADINNATFAFNDIAHIVGTFGPNKITFFDKNPIDDLSQYQAVGYDCFGRININFPQISTPHQPPQASAQGSLDIDLRANANASCANAVPGSRNITIADNGKGRIMFYFLDATHIQSLDTTGSAGGKFTQSATNPNLFFQDQDSATVCRDRLVLLPGNKVRFYELDPDTSRGSVAPPDAQDPTCHLLGINLTNVENQNALSTLNNFNDLYIPLSDTASLAVITGAAGAAAAGGVVEPSCNNAPGVIAASLKWFLCPMLSLMDGMIDWLDTKLEQELITPDPTTFSQASQMHEAWGRIRNVALIILVPIMLFMVIGTAIGMSFLDAYTVRRAMPRFLIAVVFISTSWYITAFLINLTNAVGTGILGLMTQPFNFPGMTTSLYDLVKIDVGGALILPAAGGVFLTLILTGGITFGVLLSFALVTAAALAIGFILLTIRQLLILTLVLFAPLAILSWVFPSNDKLWKLWWGTFSRLLLLFPLVMLLIGAGRIFAFVIANTP